MIFRHAVAGRESSAVRRSADRRHGQPGLHPGISPGPRDGRPSDTAQRADFALASRFLGTQFLTPMAVVAPVAESVGEAGDARVVVVECYLPGFLEQLGVVRRGHHVDRGEADLGVRVVRKEQ